MLFRHRNKVHLLRNTFRYASRKYWDQIAKGHPTGLHRGQRAAAQ